MKKLVLALLAVASLGAVHAQNLVNGDFEGVATPLLPGVATDCPGWGPGLYTMDPMSPFAGTQSAKMRTIVDAALNAQLGLGSDTIPGAIIQEVSGSWANIGNMSLSYARKNLMPAGDTAIIVCQFIDTMGAGFNDDVVLFQAYGAYTGNQTCCREYNGRRKKIESTRGCSNTCALRINIKLLINGLRPNKKRIIFHTFG